MRRTSRPRPTLTWPRHGSKFRDSTAHDDNQMERPSGGKSEGRLRLVPGQFFECSPYGMAANTPARNPPRATVGRSVPHGSSEPGVVRAPNEQA
jgi:hypothetical protein